MLQFLCKLTSIHTWINHFIDLKYLLSLYILFNDCKNQAFPWKNDVCIDVWSNRGFPGGSDDKESTCQRRRHRFNPWFGKIPWRRKWQPTQVFLPGEFHGQRSLMGLLQSLGLQSWIRKCLYDWHFHFLWSSSAPYVWTYLIYFTGKKHKYWKPGTFRLPHSFETRIFYWAYEHNANNNNNNNSWCLYSVSYGLGNILKCST